MQAASTLLLSALILTHLTTFHITSCWGALFCPDSVRLSMWSGDVWLFLPDHIRLNCRRLLGLKNQGSPPYVSSVCKAFMKIYFNYVFILPSNLNTFFINSLGNSRNLWHYQWPAEFIKQRKPASKWHQIAWKMNVFFFFFFFFFLWGVNNRIILKSMVLLLRHCKRKWSSYLNVKNRYLGMTGVTKKFHKSIAKLNYELNNNKKRCEG